MKFFGVLLPLLPLAFARPSAPSTFSNVTVFVPPSNYTDPRVLYARTAQLNDGTLLATWENYSPEPPQVYFPVYKSTDGGYTWAELSRVQDTQNGWGLRYQPFLYVLPKRIGKFKKGTVLLAGSSIPTDLSQTQIELYASSNNGRTWNFVSHIAHGGVALPNNGETPRANATHGQKMVHQVSSDLKTWDSVVDDIVYPTYTDRPGMPTVALLPNGKYIMTYEYGGGPHPDGSKTPYWFPVYFRISEDPLDFNSAEGHPVITAKGVQPAGSPYVVWTPVGGANGTIVVSSGGKAPVYVNTQLGEGAWTEIPTPEGISYTRHLRVLKGDGSKLLIMGGGHLPPSTTNRITVSVMDIKKAVAGQ
ncbi:hypothetical protein H2203_004063 [Taxawa tesnikishii (nom. ined.)]|nr:hypothetical protein H2203_004063 [Dothideales sp. JES 119]